VKSCIAIRHVAFEDLGLLEPLLADRGVGFRYVDAGCDDIVGAGADDADLLVVLGGPIGAYEDVAYPFLTEELAAIERRLREGRPVMGICLGAQLMARALGGRVAPNPAGKEIGWSPLTLSDAGRDTELSALDGVPVLHWHGDRIELPDGAVCLASTPLTPVQAFTWGGAALALQFHPEATARGLERWLIGHTAELAGQGIVVPALRAENRRLAPGLEKAGRAMLSAWLDRVGL
jgi:GMP synthase (glutamine-hydrolysing)